MNEAAMLPHIIQCSSNAVSSLEPRGDNEEAEKSYHSKLRGLKVGEGLLW